MKSKESVSPSGWVGSWHEISRKSNLINLMVDHTPSYLFVILGLWNMQKPVRLWWLYSVQYNFKLIQCSACSKLYCSWGCSLQNLLLISFFSTKHSKNIGCRLVSYPHHNLFTSLQILESVWHSVNCNVNCYTSHIAMKWWSLGMIFSITIYYDECLWTSHWLLLVSHKL